MLTSQISPIAQELSVKLRESARRQTAAGSTKYIKPIENTGSHVLVQENLRIKVDRMEEHRFDEY